MIDLRFENHFTDFIVVALTSLDPVFGKVKFEGAAWSFGSFLFIHMFHVFYNG